MVRSPSASIAPPVAAELPVRDVPVIVSELPVPPEYSPPPSADELPEMLPPVMVAWT